MSGVVVGGPLQQYVRRGRWWPVTTVCQAWSLVARYTTKCYFAIDLIHSYILSSVTKCSDLIISLLIYRELINSTVLAFFPWLFVYRQGPEPIHVIEPIWQPRNKWYIDESGAKHTTPTLYMTYFIICSNSKCNSSGMLTSIFTRDCDYVRSATSSRQLGFEVNCHCIKYKVRLWNHFIIQQYFKWDELTLIYNWLTCNM